MKRRIKVTIANKKQTQQNTNPNKEAKDSDIMYFNIYTLLSSGYPKYSFYHISKGTDGKVNDIDSIMKSFDECYKLQSCYLDLYPIGDSYKTYKDKISKGEFVLTKSIKMSMNPEVQGNPIDIIYSIFENDFIYSQGKSYYCCENYSRPVVKDSVTYIIENLIRLNPIHQTSNDILNNSVKIINSTIPSIIMDRIACGPYPKESCKEWGIPKYIAMAFTVYLHLTDLYIKNSLRNTKDPAKEEPFKEKSSEAYLVFIKNVNANKSLHIRVPSEESINKLKDKLKKYENLKYLDQVNISNFETSIDTKVKVLYGFYRAFNDNYETMHNIEDMHIDPNVQNILKQMTDEISNKVKNCSLKYLEMYKHFEQNVFAKTDFPDEYVIDTALQLINKID